MTKDLKPEIGIQDSTDLLEKTSKGCHIILWNDEVNTFPWVIQSLVEVCNHSSVQAEQSAVLVHLKGKASIKNGTFEKLRPMAEALIDRGLNATIEDK